DARHLQVEEHELRRMRGVAPLELPSREEEVEGLGAVAGDLNAVRQVPFLERAERQLHVVLVVLDQQDLHVVDVHRVSSPVGRARKKVAPSPSFASTQTRPPCRSTTRLTIASPTPVPSNSSCRWRRWNTPKR